MILYVDFVSYVTDCEAEYWEEAVLVNTEHLPEHLCEIFEKVSTERDSTKYVPVISDDDYQSSLRSVVTVSDFPVIVECALTVRVR